MNSQEQRGGHKNKGVERPLRQDPGRLYHGVIATAEPRGLAPLNFALRTWVGSRKFATEFPNQSLLSRVLSLPIQHECIMCLQ